jgi:cobalt/nickel transport system permease protein
MRTAMHHAHIDKFAYLDSPVHRLDPRIKLIAVIFFTIAVISLPKTALGIVAVYAIFPFALISIGRIPLTFVLKHLLIVSPFILVLAASFPFYNQTKTVVYFGPWQIETTLGWIAFVNITFKFIITMASLIAFVCTTRFADLLCGMEKMGLPSVLVNQLGFLYRYIFVLIDRAHHIIRARTSRTLRYLGIKREAQVAGAMIGSLLVLSIESSEKINIAMQARGFDGQFRTLTKLRTRPADYIFITAVVVFIVTVYIFFPKTA